MGAIRSRTTAGVIGGALVLLALAGPASAAAPRGTVYGGSGTGQDAVVLKLSPNGTRVTTAAIMVDVTCDSGKQTALRLNSPSPIAIRPNGSFTRPLEGTMNVSGAVVAHYRAVLKGRVAGMRITGSATVDATITGGDGAVVDQCRGTSRFTARSQKGRVFAGLTSQQAPAVLELTATGVSVKHFHIGWTAGCSGDRGFSYGDTVTNFSIVRGRFGDQWTDTETTQDGWRFSWQYNVRGVVSSARAGGTFRFQQIMISPDGVSTECDTGTVTYRMTSD